MDAWSGRNKERVLGCRNRHYMLCNVSCTSFCQIRGFSQWVSSFRRRTGIHPYSLPWREGVRGRGKHHPHPSPLPSKGEGIAGIPTWIPTCVDLGSDFYPSFSSFSNTVFQQMAATTAPTMGATMKSHSWLSASPPTRTAGPKLLAGLTDVPVMGIPTRWISVSASPIDIPANPPGAALWVEPNITKRNIPVNAASKMKHAAREYPAGELDP